MERLLKYLTYNYCYTRLLFDVIIVKHLFSFCRTKSCLRAKLYWAVHCPNVWSEQKLHSASHEEQGLSDWKRVTLRQVSCIIIMDISCLNEYRYYLCSILKLSMQNCFIHHFMGLVPLFDIKLFCKTRHLAMWTYLLAPLQFGDKIKNKQLWRTWLIKFFKEPYSSVITVSGSCKL